MGEWQPAPDWHVEVVVRFCSTRTRSQMMKTGLKPGKRERLEARVTSEQKALFQRAADLSGRSLSDFVIRSVQAAAEEAIRTHQVLELTARETEAFVAALENPPAPNERLRAAARRYVEFTSQQRA
ncbi:MAG: DUF1778 domain-containing protein [Chloroflexi bacterium]|nr:DUF1778 domain-containing protein [Chloroflexota bacterium]